MKIINIQSTCCQGVISKVTTTTFNPQTFDFSFKLEIPETAGVYNAQVVEAEAAGKDGLTCILHRMINEK